MDIELSQYMQDHRTDIAMLAVLQQNFLVLIQVHFTMIQ
ncbi:unnamed protein product [Acidocella sp. C78]|nr:unnamed protein product [Acidocella sp. C78]